MEYVFGTNSYSGVETLRTKGSEHTNFDGFVETVQEFDDSTITDTFHVVSKTKSDDDAEGNCYDWYIEVVFYSASAGVMPGLLLKGGRPDGKKDDSEYGCYA